MILELEGNKPIISSGVFVAENAAIIGDVNISENASIWFNVVIRGDINSIKVGKNSNIQDLTMIHVPDNFTVEIGDNVTVGHKALIHGCKIGDNCLIGMGSIIMDGVEIGENCIIGAGSLITQGTKIPEGSLVLGSPGKVKREVTEEEIKAIGESAKHYYDYSRKYI